jgi:hypothetical protein
VSVCEEVFSDQTTNHVAVFSLAESPGPSLADLCTFPAIHPLSFREQLNLATTLLRIPTDHDPTGNL